MDSLFTEYTGKTTAKCVVAIDFGTSGTGYAYAFPSSGGDLNARTDVYTNGQWEDGTTGKTKTILLLDDNDDFLAFGGQAENKYKALAVHGRGKYFQFFKMQLYTESSRGEHKLKSQNGHVLSAKLVFKKSLEYLRATLMAQIRKEDKRVSVSDIKWILTVPAIWSDAAKQVMSDASQAAGMGTVGGQRMQLALEPEAASVWCLRAGELKIETGDQYIVVDCGGGTIDVTVHKKVDGVMGKSVKEIIPANGGDWGSTSIDRRVLKMLEDIFGQRRYKTMTEDATGHMLLLREIEAAKCSFDLDTDIVFVLPDTLTSHEYGEDSAADAINVYNKRHGVKIFYRKPNFAIPAIFFANSLMGPTIKSTIKHVEGVLSKTGKISQIILAGNFANCRMLQNEFKKFETRGLKVLIPNLPGETVMKGAVLFGANPGLVPERLARFTYGVNTSTPFIEGKHPPDKKYTANNGIVYCSDIFSTIITEGEECVLGQPIEKPFLGIEPDQRQITFDIYKTPRRNVSYIDEFRVNKIGSVTIDIQERYESVKFIMIMTTELIARAINKAGQQREVKLKFTD